MPEEEIQYAMFNRRNVGEDTHKPKDFYDSPIRTFFGHELERAEKIRDSINQTRGTTDEVRVVIRKRVVHKSDWEDMGVLYTQLVLF